MALTEIEDTNITNSIIKGDGRFTDFVKTKGFDANILLRNGETVLTLAHKSLKVTIGEYADICRDFQNIDNGFHTVIETIIRLSKKEPPNSKRAIALTQFSSEAFLTRLNIPQEDWPQARIGQGFDTPRKNFQPLRDANLNKWGQTNKLIETLYEIPGLAAKTNKNCEKPTTLYAECLVTREEKGKFIDKTDHVIDAADQINENLSKKVSAQTFLKIIKDPDVVEYFTWLKKFKPDEETFSVLFPPDNDDTEIGGREHYIGMPSEPLQEFKDDKEEVLKAEKEKAEREKQLENERQAAQKMGISHKEFSRLQWVSTLEKAGFYDWQPMRKTMERMQDIAKALQGRKELQKIMIIEKLRETPQKNRGLDREPEM